MSPPANRPASLGDLARKITSRTTDFLALCIVLAASLTLGSQIVIWWQTPAPSIGPPSDPALAAPGWEDKLQPVDLEFGDLPLALTRQVVAGDREAAVAELVRHCQSVAERAALPERESDDAERRLLDRTVDLSPVAEEPGVWQVFVVDEQFPLVAAVRRFAGGKVSDRGLRRLVCYGLAMPAGEQLWTTFLLKGSPAGAASRGDSADVPLPPGAARTLSLRDERGSSLVGFTGRAAAADWMRFYDDSGAARGWSRSGEWSLGNQSWSARFARREGGALEVRFAKDRRGDLSGLVQVIPEVSESNEQKETRP